jgi:hypothetical protein
MADLTTVPSGLPKRFTDQGDGTFAEKCADSLYSADSLANAAAIVAPAIGGVIASITPAPPAGTYEVRVKASYGGTADVIDGMELRKGAAKISSLHVPAVVNGFPEVSTFPRVTLDGNTVLSVNASQAGAVGSVYNAEIVATRLY